ncbi:MAG: hypothetical protein K2J70_01440 [Muribaculaceae bacterium]|nr:hypothetical protein [Muribaculaceae bacterium]
MTMKMTGKKMMVFLASIAVAMLAMTGCGKKGAESDSGFPKDFAKLSDTEKVAYVMRTSSPDSVARFVIEAALGQKKGLRIDTLAIAEDYAMTNYTGEKLEDYIRESTRLKEEITLSQRFILFNRVKTNDPVSFGLELGLGYLSRVREKNLSAKDVEKEIEDFRKVCGEDTATYRRFVTGFTEALRLDKDKDVKKEIYEKFINLR